jgi:hypothetical protein
MGIKDLIFTEIEKIPEKQLPAVLEFIRSLEEGKIFKEKTGTAIASESSLKKDWLKPEEDKAWKDL